ncbi:hypothetical protein [Gemmata sp.]|uniref:hypothetical protein n=1 Tax=Gemmata sp. TaxID=1914242 RepID=UPI003F7062C1
MNESNELTDFQLLTLREMTAEHFRSTLDAPSDREFRSRYVAGLVALTKYVGDEGIAGAVLRLEDRTGLGLAYDAAVLLDRADEVAARGGTGRQVLAAAGCLPPPQISDTQQLELQLLCADVREASAASKGLHQTRFVAAMAAVVRYCRAENITPAQFSQVDRREFSDASLAAGLLAHPDSFTSPGCLGFRVLTAAGVPVPPHVEDDDE